MCFLLIAGCCLRLYCSFVKLCFSFFRFFSFVCKLRREYWWMHKLEQRTKNKSIRVVVDGSVVSSFCKHILIKHRTHYVKTTTTATTTVSTATAAASPAMPPQQTACFSFGRCSCVVVFISFGRLSVEWNFARSVSVSLSPIKKYLYNIHKRTRIHVPLHTNARFRVSTLK